VYLNILALPCPRLLSTVLLPPRTGFNPRPIRWRYLVDKVVAGDVSFRHFSLQLYVSFHQRPVFIDLCITLTYLFTYLLISWSRVFLEKLTSFQLVKKFPAFNRTWKFITEFTCAHNLPLSCASWYQSIGPGAKIYV
jgi:hypothetical protein